MKKTILIFLSLAVYSFSLNDVSVPNNFTASTPARSSEVNANFDSLKSRINQNNDTLDQSFIRFSDLESGDSLLEKCRIDTARIDHIKSNPDVDSLKGNPYIDTVTTTVINTGHGNNELYPMDQDVKTTASPTFATVNTGNGANELYPMNQGVRTTDTTTFAKLYIGTRPANDYFWALALGNKSTLYSDGALKLMQNCYYNSGWLTRAASTGACALLISDGSFGVVIGGQTSANANMNADYAIYSNALRNTALGKTTFVGGNRLEVEGNAYVSNKLSSDSARIDDTLWVGTTDATKLYDGWYKEGWYLCTLGGFTTVVTDTVRYVKVGKHVTLTFCPATGTRNTGPLMSISFAAMPVAIRPQRPTYLTISAGGISGLTTDTPEFVFAPPSAMQISTFATSGTGGFSYSKTVTYSLQ